MLVAQLNDVDGVALHERINESGKFIGQLSSVNQYIKFRFSKTLETIGTIADRFFERVNAIAKLLDRRANFSVERFAIFFQAAQRLFESLEVGRQNFGQSSARLFG